MEQRRILRNRGLVGTQEELMQAREEKERELDKIIKLQGFLEKYPDLQKNKDRWGKVRYSTSRVNTRVTDVEIHHSCGCCPEASLYARPYREEGGVRLYADPAYFWVGENNYENGDLPRDEWDVPMRDAGIPEEIVQKVQQFFDEHTPEPQSDNEK